MIKVLFIFLSTLILFSSCSNVAETQKQPPLENTLKNLILNKENKISWTKELEEDRLITDIYNDAEHISMEVPLSPYSVNVSKNDDNLIYPELKDFGSMDIRLIPSDIKSVVLDFCNSLSKDVYNGPEKYFDEKYIFNYVFFRNDLIDNWKSNFGVEFPQKRIENEESTDNKNKKVKNPSLFNKWILGKPFIATDIIQQPVRFYCNRGYVDFVIYLRLDNKKIYQISRGVYGK